MKIVDLTAVGDRWRCQASFTHEQSVTLSRLYETLAGLSHLKPRRFSISRGPKRGRWRSFTEMNSAERVGTGGGAIFFDVGERVSDWFIDFRVWPQMSLAVCLEDVDSVSEDWLRICRDWDTLFGIAHAYVHSYAELDAAGEIEREIERYRGSEPVPRELPEVYWWTGLAPDLVARLGREHVVSTPVDRIELFENGPIFLRSCPRPEWILAESTIAERANIRTRLCVDVEYASELGKLQQRAHKVRPVETEWEPAVEELILGIAHTYPVAKRLTFIRRLSRFQPRVGEQGPLDDADWRRSESPGHDVRLYRATAEQFVTRHLRENGRRKKAAIYHTVRDRNPESLLHLDISFWKSQPGKRDPLFVEAFLGMAVGAYLGCMIEAQLGGRWEPADVYTRSRVVVGNRAWYPFLRAERCLEGATRRQVLLHSLYCFYRTVERAIPREDVEPRA